MEVLVPTGRTSWLGGLVMESRNSRVSCGGSNGKDLVRKTSGQFYTHELIGIHLVEALLKTKRLESLDTLRVIDPFCGDGRLVSWLLRSAASVESLRTATWTITLWDCDGVALEQARQNVTHVAADSGISAEVVAMCGDSFTMVLQREKQYEIVITNPPWEVIKPDPRDLKGLDSNSLAEVVTRFRTLDRRLAHDYALSQPSRKFAGWGTNLARCGLEAALRLLAPNGVLGIVSPASFLADQLTDALRRWVFARYALHDLAYYPSEARLFDSVDQPAITMVLSSQENWHFAPFVTVYDRNRAAKWKASLPLTNSDLESMDYCIPVHFGASGIGVLSKLKNRPTLAHLETLGKQALWVGRELDETRYRDYVAPNGENPFVKGRMIGRYQVLQQPTYAVRPELVRVPETVRNHRVVWRDVARPSQKRRMYATLIPPKWVTGNSLNVAYFKDNNLTRLKALLAVMNSFVFEFQARAYLATAHMSLGTLRKVRVPYLDDCSLVEHLAKLSDRCINGDCSAEQLLEIAVANAYGLDHKDWQTVLSEFSLSQIDRDKLTDTYLVSSSA